MSATTLLLLLLLLACPLSMVFMHRGGGHSHGSHDSERDVSAEPEVKSAAARTTGQPHAGCGHGDHGGTSRHDHAQSGTAA